MDKFIIITDEMEPNFYIYQILDIDTNQSRDLTEEQAFAIKKKHNIRFVDVYTWYRNKKNKQQPF